MHPKRGRGKCHWDDRLDPVFCKETRGRIRPGTGGLPSQSIGRLREHLLRICNKALPLQLYQLGDPSRLPLTMIHPSHMKREISYLYRVSERRSGRGRSRSLQK